MIMRFKEEEKPLTASMHLRAHCSLLIIQQEIQQTNKWNNSAKEGSQYQSVSAQPLPWVQRTRKWGNALIPFKVDKESVSMSVIGPTDHIHCSTSIQLDCVDISCGKRQGDPIY